VARPLRPKGFTNHDDPVVCPVSSDQYQTMEGLGMHTDAELIHFAITHGPVER
jgi:hypothetical protein